MAEPIYKHIFNLFELADSVADRIPREASDREMYFMTLVYIEDILDKYGRGLVSQSAREAGLGKDEATHLKRYANEKTENLRSTISGLVKEYDFDKYLDNKSEQFKKEWHKIQPRGNDSPPTAW